MLTENELEYVCKVKYRLPSAGCDYVHACFVGDGSRQIGTHAKGNVVSWIPSPNPNEVTFAAESYGPERALRTILQYSPDVSWYGDQPEPIDIVATIKGGHKRRGSYTADAIAITPQGIIVYEAKTSSKIEELVSTKPDDWQRLENGDVVYLPAREAFARFGLRHEVFVYKPEDGFYVANLNQLLWIRECEGIASIAPNVIDRALEKNFTPTIAELKNELSLFSYAPIYKAIDEDFGKSKYETYITELSLIYHELNLAIKKVKKWSRPKYVWTNLANFPGKSRIIPEPFGNALVIGA